MLDPRNRRAEVRRAKVSSPESASGISGVQQAIWRQRARGIAVVTAVAAATAGLFAFATPALAEGPHTFATTFGAAASIPANPYPLANPSDVAVDNSGDSSNGDFYVTDPTNHRVEKFDSSGNFLLMFGKEVDQTSHGDVCPENNGDVCQAGTSGSAAGQFDNPHWVAVDDSAGASRGDVYVGDSAAVQVQKFEPSGQLITGWAESGRLQGTSLGHNFQYGLYGIGVQTNGNLVAFDEESYRYEFDEGGAFIEKAELGYIPSATAGIAIDAANDLYLVGPNPYDHVVKFTEAGGELGEVLPPDDTTGVAAGSPGGTNEDIYVDTGGGTAIKHLQRSCNNACGPVDTFGAGHLSDAEGIGIDGSSDKVYVANTGEHDVAVFKKLVSPPSVEGFYASHLTATTADLTAKINPRGVDTEYHFDYGTTIAYGNSAPPSPVEADLGSGYVAQTVTIHLTNLQEATTYHFRVVARNAEGVTSSYDQTFNFFPPSCPNQTVRQQTGADNLPDCRAYELASAENAGTTVIFPSDGPVTGQATNPPRLAYAGWAGAIPDSGGSPENDFGDLYVATRTNSGWITKYIGLPANETLLSGGPPWTDASPEPEIAGGELTTSDKWQQGVLANPSMSKIVDWNNGEYNTTGQYLGVGEGGFSSNAPYVWDSTTGTRIDRWPTNMGAVVGGEGFKGETAASADLSHFVFTSDLIYAPSGVPGDMYDNNTNTGELSIVSRAADGGDIALKPLRVSAEGSHILMTTGAGQCKGVLRAAPSCGPGQLYMRVSDAVTYEIAPGQEVNYLGMTSDGSKVYFTSNEELNAEDTDEGADLYMWSAEKAAHAEEPLTLLSKGDGGSGNSESCSAAWTTRCSIVPVVFMDPKTGGYPNFEGGLGGNGMSDSYIAAESGDIYFYSPELLNGDMGLKNQENLYVYRHGGVHFVTALTPDNYCVEGGNGQGKLCSHGPVVRMDVSPDGSHMAFITASQVTSYENQGALEMYSYEPESGQIVCDSCSPTGEPPAPPQFTGEGESQNVLASQNGLFMTDDGRTFFSTEQALVPRDTNESEDVYEFVDGRPQLITPGTGAGYHNSFGVFGVETNPGLVGVSADGTDVYFATYEHLVEQDLNGEQLKIYDARTDGGFAFVKPPPGCAAADECHGEGGPPPARQIEGSGAALGARGNLHVTPKRHSKKQRHRKHRARVHHNQFGSHRHG